MSKGEQTREAILETALAAASTVGLSALSIGGLAKQAGMSKSGLFAHFASKENLQLEVLRAATAHFIEVVLTPALKKKRGEPRVRALFENWFAWSSNSTLPGGCLFIAAASEFDDQPGAIRDFLVASQRDWLSTLSQAARVAVEEGDFRKDLDTEQFAHELYSILLAYHHFSRLLKFTDAKERALLSFEQIVEAARA
jgi:AcrR family transcriptional regulator